MLEHRSQPLLPPARFVRRQARFTLLSAAVILSSLSIGACGYHLLENKDWLDSYYLAAMILTGMGPSCELHTSFGKLFVTCYALFSAVVFLSAAGLLVTPLFHRIMHRLHLEEAEQEGARS